MLAYETKFAVIKQEATN